MMLSTTTNAEGLEDGLDPESVVTAVCKSFGSCNVRPSDPSQFTILAGFCFYDTSTKELKVPALATGAKCLPTSRYPLRGDALHDSHAEVLARRSLVRWLYEEIKRASHTSGGSAWLKHDSVSGKFMLKDDVKVYMYVSTVPCGDASMRFLAAAQDPEMAALKDSCPPPAPILGAASRGRDGYFHYGVLRTKPGRADSPPTHCMSCSDKIASWNVLGLQGSLASRFIHPVYLDAIIIGDVPEHLRDPVREDCERALHGRLKNINGLDAPFRLATPMIIFTDTEFLYSRTSVQRRNPLLNAPASCNESLTWTADVDPPSTGLEVLVNGTRRGVSPKQRALDKFIPRTSKLQLFRQNEKIARCVGVRPQVCGERYYDAKKYACPEFQAARTALKGPGGPFAGWVVSGREWESFDIEGGLLVSEVIYA